MKFYCVWGAWEDAEVFYRTQHSLVTIPFFDERMYSEKEINQIKSLKQGEIWRRENHFVIRLPDGTPKCITDLLPVAYHKDRVIPPAEIHHSIKTNVWYIKDDHGVMAVSNNELQIQSTLLTHRRTAEERRGVGVVVKKEVLLSDWNNKMISSKNIEQYDIQKEYKSRMGND